LSDKVFAYLKQEEPSRLTITLDGPPEAHNQSRPLKNGGETFGVILNNIKRAVSAGLKVAIRVNVSSRNVRTIHELFDILDNSGLKNQVTVDLQGVVSSDAHPYEQYCLTGYELTHSILSIYRTAANKGWIVMPELDNMRILGFCLGEYPNRIITDLNGGIHRCTQMADSDLIGNISETGLIKLKKDKNDYWVQKDPLKFDECRKCAFLPLCMGGCNMQRLDGNPYCLGWKHDVPTFLEVLMLNQRNLVPNDSTTD